MGKTEKEICAKALKLERALGPERKLRATGAQRMRGRMALNATGRSARAKAQGP